MQTDLHARERNAAGDGGKSLPVLYIKPACPWCREAVAFLDEHGIPYRRVDVGQDAQARCDMERVSGQSKVPTLDWNGEVLADFGVDELVPFLRSRNVKLEDS
jgi:Glutaredoxin and related proteins